MATAPDTTLVTGPNFQQATVGTSLVTPTNGTQATMADLFGGVSTAPALKATTFTATTGTITNLTTGTLITSGLSQRSVQAGITAGTTQTIAGGTKVTASVVTISTCANTGDAVTLPVASSSTVGQHTWIFNNGAKAASVFPGEAGTKIDGGSAGAAVTLTNAKNATFIQTDASNWISAQGGAVSA